MPADLNWDDRGWTHERNEPPRGRRRRVADGGTAQGSRDSFGARSTLSVDGTDYDIFRLDAVEGAEKLPFSLKVLLENLLRTEDGADITADHIRAIANWDPSAEPDQEIQFTPARVVMQDFTGVPASSTSPPCARPWPTWAATRRRSTRSRRPSWSSTTRSSPTSSARRSPSSATSRSSTSATASATSSCAGARAPSATSRSSRRAPASCTRSTSSTWRAWSSRGRRATGSSPTPTPAWAPTPTPRWSTAWACWAGASAASRPRRPCSASPSRCSSPASSASS